ncbi:hypothetical protein [Actinocorallia populi]|uniref:hypothetical protein n=1 Tax=Actinocorallia populi TaxID=2079200 RepID=UPI000D0977C1|nr:hypothetical protein [Actinocorallia populi]
MTTTHSEERRAKFAEDVAGQKVGAGNASAADGRFRIIGLVVMILGVVGTFVSYSNSLALDDNRDIASTQILAVAFLAVTLLGAALYVAAAVTRVLRLWLMRQLAESQAHTEAVTEALSRR